MSVGEGGERAWVVRREGREHGWWGGRGESMGGGEGVVWWGGWGESMGGGEGGERA